MKQVNDLNKEAEQEITEVLVGDIDKFETMVVEKWKHILYGIIAIVIAISIIVFTIDAQNKQNKVVASAFGDVTSSTITAKNIDDINKVIEAYPNDIAVVPAKIKLAKIAIDEKKYDDAIGQYNEILKLNIQKPVKERIQINLAYVNELKADKDAAVKVLLDLVKNATISKNIKNEANFALGRIYVSQKKNDEAKKVLVKVAESDSMFKAQANSLLGNL